MPTPDQEPTNIERESSRSSRTEIVHDPNADRPDVRASAIIVAAGNSTRMAASSTRRKPWIALGGCPLIEHTLQAFQAAAEILEVILVVHEADLDSFEQRAQEQACYAKVKAIVPGGELRADSVRIGLEQCTADMNVVCIHDGARPLVSPTIIKQVVETAANKGAALVAVRVHDTIKRDVQGSSIPMASETLDRSQLWAAQTPQAFELNSFRIISATAAGDGYRPTDDSAIWERYRGPVPIIEGSRDNMKLTTPEQLPLFEALLLRNAERAT